MNGKHAYLKNLLLFTQLGLSVVSPILVCAAIGWAAQKYWHAPSFVMVVLILIGVASGLLCAFKLICRMSQISAESDLNGKGKEK